MLAISKSFSNFAKNMKKENSGEIVMYQPDETIRLEVRMGEDSVWLTQQQMAELFQTDRTSIVRHIQTWHQVSPVG